MAEEYHETYGDGWDIYYDQGNPYYYNTGTCNRQFSRVPGNASTMALGHGRRVLTLRYGLLELHSNGRDAMGEAHSIRKPHICSGE